MARRGPPRKFGEDLDRAIVQMPVSGATISDVAQEIGCSVALVKHRMKLIRQEVKERRERVVNGGAGGRRPESIRRARKELKEALTEPTRPRRRSRQEKDHDALDMLLSNLDAIEVLSDEAMEKLLSGLATSASPTVRVQAITKLDDMKAKHRPAESKGPPPPMTEEERVKAMRDLMEAVGQGISAKAWGKAFGDPDGPRVVGEEAVDAALLD